MKLYLLTGKYLAVFKPGMMIEAENARGDYQSD